VLQWKNPESKQDVRATSDGKDRFWLRSGQNISIPITEGSTLHAALATPLSTKDMKGVQMFRQLTMRSTVFSKYGSPLIPGETPIETRITGHEAGVFGRATLVIEPQTVFVEITDYFPVGASSTGEVIYLKPGKWRLRIYASFRSFQSPDGLVSQYAQRDSESLITGKKFGKEPTLNSSTGEYLDGLLYLNQYGVMAYGIIKIGRAFGFLFRRPNIVLPIQTEVFFQIDRIEATYLMNPSPKGLPRPIE